MTTDRLYYEYSYLMKNETGIWNIDPSKGIQLVQTIFFPQSSTEFGDHGTINGIPVECVKIEEELWHVPNNMEDMTKFRLGKAECEIDWDRRQHLLRNHTAMHLLAYILDNMGHRVAGGQVQEDNTHIIMREIVDENLILEAVEEANRIIPEDRKVTTYNSTKETDRPGFRYCEIEGFGAIPCGGIHVKSTGFIGKIEVTETIVRKKKTYIYLKVEKEGSDGTFEKTGN